MWLFDNKPLSLQECAKYLDLSENTIKYSFSRTKENLEKRGIYLTKKGRGNETQYFINDIPQ